jgi:hypothetical protein
MATRQHLQWGTQIVWTYGPIGFLDTTIYVYPGQWMAALAVSIAAHLLLIALLFFYLRDTQAKAWQWLLVGGILVLPNPVWSLYIYQAALASLLLFFFALYPQISFRLRYLATVAAAALLASLSLVKGTAAVGAIALLGGFLILTLVRRALLLGLVAPATFLVATTLFWLASGQAPATIMPYLRANAEIIFGFAGAMGSQDLPLPRALVVVTLLVLTLLFTLVLALRQRRARMVDLVILAATLLPVYFKEGFVRHDAGHESAFFSVALLILALVGVRVLNEVEWQPPIKGLSLVASGAVLLQTLITSTQTSLSANIPGSLALLGVNTVVRTLGLEAIRLASYGTAFSLITSKAERGRYESETKSALRRTYALPDSLVSKLKTGSVDILPWDIGIAYSYDLQWDPRPVLQSYSAYTPALDKLDAAHFSGPSRPGHVLLAYKSIDNRYPLFDEPAVFRELAANYTLTQVDNVMLLLTREERPKLAAALPVSLSAEFGQEVSIPTPNDGPLYATIRVATTTWGQVKALVYKPSRLFITFRYADGQVSQPFRFVPAVAEDGVPVSNFVSDAQDLASLFDNRGPPRILSFRLSGNSRLEYGSRFQVTFFRPGG